METTIPEEEWDMWEEKVTMVRKEAFPYLDMKLYWDKQDLHFTVKAAIVPWSSRQYRKVSSHAWADSP
eukprot:8710147-Ditylum_brightwellii.AAC.1